MNAALVAFVVGTCFLVSGIVTIISSLSQENLNAPGAFTGIMMSVMGGTLLVVGLVLCYFKDTNRSRARSARTNRPRHRSQSSRYVAQPSQRPVLPSGYAPHPDQMTVSYSYVPPGHQSSHPGSRHHTPVPSRSPTPSGHGSRHHTPVSSRSPNTSGRYLRPTAPEGGHIAPATPHLLQPRSHPGSRHHTPVPSRSPTPSGHGSRHHTPVPSRSPSPSGRYLRPTAPEGGHISHPTARGSRGSWGDPRIVGPTAPEYQAPQPYNPEEDLPPPYSEVVKEGSYPRY